MATEQEKQLMNEASATLAEGARVVAELLAEIERLNATIERLRAELEAEQVRTICAMCGEELTRMAKVTP